MKTLLSFLFFTCITFNSFSQICTGDFIFETQASVDQFILDNPTCTTIDGNVYITVYGTDPVQNTLGLQNITSILGGLYITADALVDLQGLGNITNVNELELSGPMSSAQMAPLSSIQSISQLTLYASEMEDFHAFDGLVSLTNLSINFSIIPGEPLISFYDVFPGLTSVSGTLDIGVWDDSACDTLTGFNSLTHAGKIRFGPSGTIDIVEFDGLHNLEVIDQELYFDVIFQSVSGFENLHTAGNFNFFELTCDCDLLSFDALTDINDVGMFCYAWSAPRFPALDVIDGDFFYQGACDVIDFSAIDSIGGNLIMSTDFSGLVVPVTANFLSLTHVGGNMQIEGFFMLLI
ncbi:MAG: hypothetical protein ACKVOK_00415 [Flavobacteriales bacterium]